jgi:hypothetical protein
MLWVCARRCEMAARRFCAAPAQAEVLVRVDGEFGRGAAREPIEPRDLRLSVVCHPEHAPVPTQLAARNRSD